MALIIWGGVVPACLAAAWLVLRRPVRQFTEELYVDNARDSFRMQREWLEARFLTVMARTSPPDRLRWEDAHWHDEVLWARDRKSRVFLALIGVHFREPGPSGFEDERDDLPPRHATALFEFRKGRWHAEAKLLDELRPDEAVLLGQRFEPVVLHPRRVY